MYEPGVVLILDKQRVRLYILIIVASVIEFDCVFNWCSMHKFEGVIDVRCNNLTIIMYCSNTLQL